MWDRNLEKGDEIVADDYRLGRPHWVDMKAGDALIFHSNHLHSSQLNYSQTTRVVLTNRVCLDEPIYPDLGKPHRYFHSAAFPAADDFDGLFAAPGFVGDATSVAPPQTPEPATQAKIDAELAARRAAGREFLFDPAELSMSDAQQRLSEGQIIALDAKTCIARIDGEDYEFPRRCPHEAADLAKGFVENGKIVCPFHGARLCPVAGKCAGIATMNFRARKVLTCRSA
ncbi:MAG: Rieske 2Fe-2S domain-containing protein [Myxococcota bacterium]